jgi:hypothetical protein
MTPFDAKPTQDQLDYMKCLLEIMSRPPVPALPDLDAIIQKLEREKILNKQGKS